MNRIWKITLLVVVLFTTLACVTLMPQVESNQQEDASKSSQSEEVSESNQQEDAAESNQPEEAAEANQQEEAAESDQPEDAAESDQPTEAVVPESTILFEDDFSDSNSGWDRSSSDNGSTDYDNGVYRMMVNQPGYDIWANPGLYFEGAVSIEVDATKVGGEEDDDYGLLCRYTGVPSSPSYYFFWISSDGFAVIGKVTAGTMEFISSESMVATNAINQGRATNHLRADCIGDSLEFYVNGQMVASAVDSDFAGGDIGFVVGTFDIPFAEFTFDNLVVTVP